MGGRAAFFASSAVAMAGAASRSAVAIERVVIVMRGTSSKVIGTALNLPLSGDVTQRDSSATSAAESVHRLARPHIIAQAIRTHPLARPPADASIVPG